MTITALLSAGWAAVTLLAPLVAVSLLLWVADSRSSAPAVDAVRLALDAWLLGHGVPLRLPGGTFGLIPLLLTALIWWQLCSPAC